jgi:triacylglycerol lipase
MDVAMDTQTALQAAEFERISYLNEDAPMPEGFRRVYNIMLDDAAGSGQAPNRVYFGFFAESWDTIVIAIRGTETWLEWAQDARYEKEFWKTDGDMIGNVAKGFYDLYKSSLLLPDGLLSRTKKLIIVGHSLGAALATLWAADLYHYSPETYLFAPPNVGDATFKTYFDRNLPNTYRIYTLSDIVPHLPPTVFGFVPVGQEVPLLVIDNPTVSHDLATYTAAIRQGRFLRS